MNFELTLLKVHKFVILLVFRSLRVDDVPLEPIYVDLPDFFVRNSHAKLQLLRDSEYTLRVWCSLDLV